VAACEAVLRELMSTADLNKAEKRLNGEKERIQAKAVALNNEASHRLISDYGERRGELERKLSSVEEKLKAINSERSDREYKARQCELYLDKVKRLNLDKNLVDAETFMALVDKVIVGEGMKFILKDGSEWSDLLKKDTE
jgi:tetrahydromethanopterin S-methyltransferase subunit G